MARLGRSFPATPVQFGAIAAADNELSATGTLSITGAALLNATGALQAAGSLSISGTADLDAAGSLAAAGSLSISGAADLDAVGSLLAGGSVSISGSADLDAIGNLAAGGSLSISGTAELTGSNDLAASGSLSITGAASLTAIGQLLAAGSITINGNAQLDSGELPPASEEPTVTPAGSNKRRKRYFVEIDGQSFEVDGPEHARALLDRAREIAKAHAREIAKEKVSRETTRRTGKRPVALPTPRIASPNPELREVVREARKQINDLYRSTAIDAELSLLMARQLELEDEEETLLLLI